MSSEYIILADPLYIHHINSKKEIEQKISQLLNGFRIIDKNMILPIRIYKELLKRRPSHIEISQCLSKYHLLEQQSCYKEKCTPKKSSPKMISGYHSDVYNMFLGCFIKVVENLQPIVILRIGDTLARFDNKLRVFFRKYGYDCRDFSIDIFGVEHRFMVCYTSL